MSARLSATRVRQFVRDGFLVGVPMLAPREIAALRARVDGIRHNLDELERRLYDVEAAFLDRPGDVVCHFLGGWLVDSALRALVFNYVAADTRALFGSAPLLRNTTPVPEGAIIEGEHFPIVLGEGMPKVRATEDADLATAPRPGRQNLDAND